MSSTQRSSTLSSHTGPNAGIPTGAAPMPTQASRRALVSSALGNIQRFKQSWISIMVLKAGVGLGQVVALLTLLALASLTPSPMYPDQKQAMPTDACPRPQLFRAWMSVQVVRLSVCWAVSCYITIRAQRRRLRESEVHQPIVGERDMVGSVAAAEWGHGLGQRSLTISSLESSTQHPPSLVHSSSSSSTVTLAHTSMTGSNSVPHTPPAIYGSSVGSTISVGDPALDTSCKARPVVEILREDMHDADLGALAMQRAESHCHIGCPTAGEVRAASGDQGTLQAARHMVEGRHVDTGSVRVGNWILTLDKVATCTSKALGIISAILFILGNVLLFSPLPSQPQSCYNAAPTLWWGVMTVTGVGWFLIAQVAVVMLGVGIGGPMILALFRTLRIAPIPPEPESARKAPSAPLRPDELLKLKSVCYVPDLTEPLPVIRENSHGHSRSTSVSSVHPTAATYDPTRLPHPPHELKSHQAACAICQENFTPPQEVRTIMMRVDALRLLGCGHVFHVDCIDQWLLRGSGNCPFCNRPVRETLAKEDAKKLNEGSSQMESPQAHRSPLWCLLGRIRRGRDREPANPGGG